MKFKQERKYAPVDYRQLRAAVLSVLDAHGPMKSDDIVEKILETGIGNEGAIKKAIKYLKDDGFIEKLGLEKPWQRVASP